MPSLMGKTRVFMSRILPDQNRIFRFSMRQNPNLTDGWMLVQLHSVELGDHLIHGGRAQALAEHHEPGSSDARIGTTPSWHDVEVLIG